MKKTAKRSSNVQDARSPLGNIYYSLKSQLVDATDGGVTPTKSRTAKALGMSDQLAALQNQANKLEARKRTRFTKASDNEVVKSLTRRK